MSVPNIADILGSPTLRDLRADIFSRMNVPGYVLTDEFQGAVGRTILEIEAFVLLDLVGDVGVAQQYGGATTVPSLDTPTDALTLLAHCIYEKDRVAPQFAFQTVVLACAAGLGPYLITAERGQLTNPAGQSFTPSTGGTLSGGGTLTIQVRSEVAGSSRGLVNKLVTPNLGGVTVQSAVTYDPGSGPLYGADGESDKALLVRVLAAWPDLGAAPPDDDRIVKWAKDASIEITRVKLDVDTVHAGAVIVTVAGASGAVSGGALAAAVSAIDLKLPITDWPQVQNATTLAVAATGGAVTVERSKLAAVQAAIDAASNAPAIPPNWSAILSATQIGGIVYPSKLEQLLKDMDGVIDVVGLQLNGNFDEVFLTSTQVPVKSGTLTAQLTWVAA